jgi:hypothetical protein
MSTNYQTTNHSNRDITKEFDIKEFNKNFESNDEKLKKQQEFDYFNTKIKDILTMEKSDISIDYKLHHNMYFLIGISIFVLGAFFITIGVSK